MGSYYDSDERSAIKGPPVSRRGRLNEPTQTTSHESPSDISPRQSADYYRSPEPVPSEEDVVMPENVEPPTIPIQQDDDVVNAVDRVVELVHGGYQQVNLEVDPGLDESVTNQLDLMAARGRLQVADRKKIQVRPLTGVFQSEYLAQNDQGQPSVVEGANPNQTVDLDQENQEMTDEDMERFVKGQSDVAQQGDTYEPDHTEAADASPQQQEEGEHEEGSEDQHLASDQQSDEDEDEG
jgi:hypothetical protein